MKPLEIGYGENKIIIYPKMISVAEQDDFQQQLNDLADTDTEKYKKEFEICRAALESMSEKPAEKLVKEKGEFKKVKIEGGLSAHFLERTIENERVVRDAYQIVLSQMRPESRFLD